MAVDGSLATASKAAQVVVALTAVLEERTVQVAKAIPVARALVVLPRAAAVAPVRRVQSRQQDNRELAARGCHTVSQGCPSTTLAVAAVARAMVRLWVRADLVGVELVVPPLELTVRMAWEVVAVAVGTTAPGTTEATAARAS